MEPSNKTAWAAWLLYLVVVLAGIFPLAYVPSALIVGIKTPRTHATQQTLS